MALVAPLLAADLNIQWQPNAAGNNVLGYNVRVYAGTTTNAPMVFNRQQTTTACTVTNLTPGVHLIRVNAFNVWGEGVDGPQSTVSTPSGKPDPITGTVIVP